MRSSSASAVAATRSARSRSRAGSRSAASRAFWAASRGSGSWSTRTRARAASTTSAAAGLLDGAAVVDPADGATTPEGVHFCESRLATAPRRAHGPDRRDRGRRRAPRAASTPPARSLACDLVVLVDIGGDAIADGSEPGPREPALRRGDDRGGRSIADVPCLLGVLGAGCDGELEPARGARTRRGALRAPGPGSTRSDVTPRARPRSRRRPRWPSPRRASSSLAPRAARSGPVEIRGGRRVVDLGPVAPRWRSSSTSRPRCPSCRWRRRSRTPRRSRPPATPSTRSGVSTELDYEERRAARSTLD